MSGGKLDTVLVVLVGMTPAVVTSTIWALAKQEDDPILPDRLVLVTTEAGAERAHTELLGAWPATRGALHDLVDALSVEGIQLNAALLDSAPGGRLEIRVARLDGGGFSEDALDDEDMDSVGNLVLSTVAEFTGDNASRLILSISGGRKTMSHFGGTAMTLLARPHDFMCHVQVSPQRLERCRPKFFFKKPEVFTPDPPIPGANNDPVDPSDVDLSISVVPFIRLGSLKVVKSLRGLIQNRGFAYLVAAVGRAIDDDRTVKESVLISWPERKMTLGQVDITKFRDARGARVLAYAALMARYGAWPRACNANQALELLRAWCEMEALLDGYDVGDTRVYKPGDSLKRTQTFFQLKPERAAQNQQLPFEVLRHSAQFFEWFQWVDQYRSVAGGLDPAAQRQFVIKRERHPEAAFYALNVALRGSIGPIYTVTCDPRGLYRPTSNLDFRETGRPLSADFWK
jgi:CRISPR-associated protein (TIGR02584 family)